MSHRHVVTSGRSVIVHRWADGGGYSHGFIAKGRGEVVLPAGSKIWAEALIQRLS